MIFKKIIARLTGFGRSAPQEFHFEKVMDSLPDSLIIIDRRGIVTAVNESCCRLLGYKRDEIVGQSASMFFVKQQNDPFCVAEPTRKDDEVYLGKILDELVLNGFVNDLDVVFMTRDCRRIPMNFNGVVLRDAKNEIIGVLGLARDMRQIKRNVKKLDLLNNISAMTLQNIETVKTMARMGTLIKNYFDADRITFYALEGDSLKSIYASEHYRDIKVKLGTGIAGHSAVTKKPYYTNDTSLDPHFFPDVDAVSGYKTLNALAMPVLFGGTLFGVVEIINKRGDFTPADTKDLEEIVNLAKFVVLEKEKDAKLAESEDRYRALVENSPNMIFVLVGDKIVFINRAGAHMLASTEPRNLEGRDILDFVPESGKKNIHRALKEAAERRKSSAIAEQIFITAAGVEVETEIVYLPFVYHGQKAVQTIARDVSHRKEAERMLKRRNLLLQKINAVAVRFATLSFGGNAHEMIAEVFKSATNASFVAVGEYAANERSLTVRALALKNEHLQKFVELTGMVPAGSSFIVSNEKTLAEMRSGKLIKIEGGIYNVLLHRIPKKICDVLHGALGIGNCYGIGFVYDGRLYANLVTGFPPGVEPDTEFIEMFVRQCALMFQRYRAEKAMCASEERFRGLVENLNDVIYEINLAGDVTYASPAVEKIMGCKPDEVVGKSFRALVHPEDLEYVEGAFAEGLTGRTFPVECRILCANGGYRWIRTLGNLHVVDGKPAGMRAVFSDINERKRAEYDLLERLKYEKMLTTISSRAVASTDFPGFMNEALALVGRTLDVSRSYIFEHRRENETMDNTYEWCAPGVSPPMDNLQGVPSSEMPWWVQLMKERQIISYSDIEQMPPAAEKEKQILRAQQIKSVMVFPLFIGDKYAGFLGFDECRETREWPPRDMDMIKTIAQIISWVFERRNSDDENEKLRAQMLQSAKLASVGELAAGLAHEIGNPLQTVLGNADLLLLEEKKEELHAIKNAALGAKQIIERLMEFSRQSEMDFLPANVNEIIDKALSLFGKQLTLDSIKVEKNYGQIPKISAAPPQLNQVFLNIITNARKAMKGGGTLSISTAPCVKQPGYVVISFKDTGCGISAADLKRIFEPFFTTGKGGTGLGLSVSYGIIKQHGGEIEIKSEGLGKGAEVTITLPSKRRA